MSEELSQHTITLARELLDDVELSRLRPEQLLLKASRLARLVENAEIVTWLDCELRGYGSDAPIARTYMGKTGRWTDESKNQGYVIPLAEIEGHIAAAQNELTQLKVPNVNFAPSSANPGESVVGIFGQHVMTATAPVNSALQRMASLSQMIGKLSGIRSRVLAVLHDFITETYYRLQYSGLAETIFEQYKTAIDIKLAEKAADVLAKVPSIYNRLANGGPEEVSQALTTCRRIIHAFADAHSPAVEEPASAHGVKLGPENYLNRINAFVDAHCQSLSRSQRIRRTLREVHERVSAGVHAEVSLEEAQALFLTTYVILGEITLLPNEKAQAVRNSRNNSPEDADA